MQNKLTPASVQSQRCPAVLLNVAQYAYLLWNDWGDDVVPVSTSHSSHWRTFLNQSRRLWENKVISRIKIEKQYVTFIWAILSSRLMMFTIWLMVPLKSTTSKLENLRPCGSNSNHCLPSQRRPLAIGEWRLGIWNCSHRVWTPSYMCVLRDVTWLQANR